MCVRVCARVCVCVCVIPYSCLKLIKYFQSDFKILKKRPFISFTSLQRIYS